MEKQTPLRERVEGTGTWNLKEPVDMVATVTYRTRKGQLLQLPVLDVAGEKISGQRSPGSRLLEA